MSTPKPPEFLGHLPTFFTDRDLGRLAFPQGLRAAGLSIVTIFEHYGIEVSQTVQDTSGCMRRLVGAGQCCAATRSIGSDGVPLNGHAERAALLDGGVREFVLNGNVPAAVNVDRVMHNLAAIVAVCNSPGPFT